MLLTMMALWLYLWKKKEANGNSGAKEFYHHQNFMRDGLDVWKKQPLEPLEERQTLTTPQLEP